MRKPTPGVVVTTGGLPSSRRNRPTVTVPSAGYFPLPWWAGSIAPGAYAVLLLGLALSRLPRRRRQQKTRPN
ncbi:hypothetical protein QFZ68_004863 [Streptomyces sp. V1I6]|nr:hypothetical protein [Streptomyces sp. V1I6]